MEALIVTYPGRLRPFRRRRLDLLAQAIRLGRWHRRICEELEALTRQKGARHV